MARYPLNAYTRRKRKKSYKGFYIFLLMVVICVVAGLMISNIIKSRKNAANDPNSKPAVKEPQRKEEIRSKTPLDLPNNNVKKTEPVTKITEPVVKKIEPPVEIKPPTATIPDREAAKIIEEGEALLAMTPPKIIAARDKLNSALTLNLNKQQKQYIRNQLTQLSEQWLFDKNKFFPDDKLCESYKVKMGENPGVIAKKYNITAELLQEINGIENPKALRADARIKVVNGPFHAKVYLSEFVMDIYLQDTYVRSYMVGIGQPGMETPRGHWKLQKGGKVVHPVWTHWDGRLLNYGDPDYALGERWMRLQGLDEDIKDLSGFGIHGTKEPDSIGKASSRGCLRLHNGNVIEVYNMLVPELSHVTIYK